VSIYSSTFTMVSVLEKHSLSFRQTENIQTCVINYHCFFSATVHRWNTDYH